MTDPAIDQVEFTCLEKPDKSRCPHCGTYEAREQNAKLRDIAERAISMLQFNSHSKHGPIIKLRAEFDQLKEQQMNDIQSNDEMPCEETTKDYTDFRKELSELINKHSLESGSNTPDFVLSNFLVDTLICFDSATISRNSRHDFPARLCMLQRERDQWRECAENLAAVLRDADVIPENEREDGRREWFGDIWWLRDKQTAVIIDRSPEEALAEFERLKGEAK
jgi:hypothetical protein